MDCLGRNVVDCLNTGYKMRDVTAPFVLHDGHLTVPTGPGIGIVPDPDALQAATTSTELLSA